jgi:hypothetical protein
VVLALAAGDEGAALAATTTLEQIRTGYDDDHLRDLLARAVALASGELSRRLSALAKIGSGEADGT